MAAQARAAARLPQGAATTTHYYAYATCSCYLLLLTTYYLLLTTHYSLLTTYLLLTHYLEVPPLPALADLVAGGAAHAPPRARPPRRRLLHGTAMGHEVGPALAPGSLPTSGEAHAAPDALDTIIMFLAGKVDLAVRPTSTPQRSLAILS